MIRNYHSLEKATKTYTNTEVKRILSNYRILTAKIDTVNISLVLNRPAQRPTIQTLAEAKGFGITVCEETGQHIRGGHCWNHWHLSFQDPNPMKLLSAINNIDARWGIVDSSVTRIDIAFDAKRKGVRRDLPIVDDLVRPNARDELLDIYRTCLEPLSVSDRWRAFFGEDSCTYYLGLKEKNQFRLYDKFIDQHQPLDPADRVLRLELSIKKPTVKVFLKINSVSDLINYRRWRKVLYLVKLKDRKNYMLRELLDRLGKSLDRLSMKWTMNADEIVFEDFLEL